MTTNRMFPLEVTKLDNISLITQQQIDATLCHLRYGHLNIKGLQLLSRKNMVQWLPEVDHLALCESCVLSKQTRRSFQTERA